MSKLFYYIENVDEDLKPHLISKLIRVSAINLRDCNPAMITNEFRWALVHKSNHSEVNDKYADLGLVIYLDRGVTGCRIETGKRYRKDDRSEYWLAGTNTVLDNFAPLVRHVESSDLAHIKDLDCRAWIRPRHLLIALDILCQGYQVTHLTPELKEISVLDREVLASLQEKSKITEREDWWMRGLGVPSTEKLLNDLKKEKVPSAVAENIIEKLIEVLSTPADCIGYDLRLMAVDTADGLVNEGRNLLIIAFVDTKLHIRIFDANGKKVVDKAENKLISGETLAAFKEQLNPLPSESGLSQEQKQKIIRDATSITNRSLMHTIKDLRKDIRELIRGEL